ncbi:hypothetical protein CNEO2_200068 [Clostridium neonatale]|uniref:Uncharacterized protein n=1 Tax=Clostridium neonatale TaxID=137838 RepID=A0AAD1YES8_9CLOT|nr:hypothetical protein CNEO2_150019 [Clostridium neonatale]CAI3203103.1 hypothetical protein CNEO2_280068 [Clostridium neonatale]CAI3219204.1 hypothetical protein CNEO2_120028 [Clostridium neonatale]CAI3248483.1 hypothetical protein CNEO2_680002 [Clostridium neonatale]CAI3553709.1 hypothetical protein CNEO2_1000002 [Clostridium neonatale]
MDIYSDYNFLLKPYSNIKFTIKEICICTILPRFNLKDYITLVI